MSPRQSCLAGFPAFSSSIQAPEQLRDLLLDTSPGPSWPESPTSGMEVGEALCTDARVGVGMSQPVCPGPGPGELEQDPSPHKTLSPAGLASYPNVVHHPFFHSFNKHVLAIYYTNPGDEKG